MINFTKENHWKELQPYSDQTSHLFDDGYLALAREFLVSKENQLAKLIASTYSGKSVDSKWSLNGT